MQSELNTFDLTDANDIKKHVALEFLNESTFGKISGQAPVGGVSRVCAQLGSRVFMRSPVDVLARSEDCRLTATGAPDLCPSGVEVSETNSDQVRLGVDNLRERTSGGIS